eukprot:1161154-Pelagomonas_calceolata.AAC.1
MVTDTFPHAQVAIRTFVLFHKAKASPSARCASACTGHLCCFSRPKPAQLYGGSCEGHIAHIHPDRIFSGKDENKGAGAMDGIGSARQGSTKALAAMHFMDQRLELATAFVEVGWTGCKAW